MIFACANKTLTFSRNVCFFTGITFIERRRWNVYDLCAVVVFSDYLNNIEITESVGKD